MANILDGMLGPLLNIHPGFAILIISFVITLITTIVYKLMTDQSLMKSLKEDMKKHQDEMKKHRDNPSKMMSHQKVLMEKNLIYMKHSMKSTLITIIPFFIIFAWLNANLAFAPIQPGDTFSTTIELTKVTGGNVTLSVPDGLSLASQAAVPITEHKAAWDVKAEKEGTHYMTYLVQGKEYTKEVLVTTQRDYAPVEYRVDDTFVKRISIGQPKLIVWQLWSMKITWFWAYFISTIVFSLGMRKLFGLH